MKEDEAKRCAILVGVMDRSSNVKICGADVELIAERLEEYGFTQIVKLTTGSDKKHEPTKRNIEPWLGLILDDPDEDDFAFVMFYDCCFEYDRVSGFAPKDAQDLPETVSLISLNAVKDKMTDPPLDLSGFPQTRAANISITFSLAE